MLPNGARIALRWHVRQKYMTGCNFLGEGFALFCPDPVKEETFGPAWFRLTDHSGRAFLDAGAVTPTRSSFFAVEALASLPGTAVLRASNGLYFGGYTDVTGAFAVAANINEAYGFDLAGSGGPNALRARFFWSTHPGRYVLLEDLGWGTIAGVNFWNAGYSPTEVFLVE